MLKEKLVVSRPPHHDEPRESRPMVDSNLQPYTAHPFRCGCVDELSDGTVCPVSKSKVLICSGGGHVTELVAGKQARGYIQPLVRSAASRWRHHSNYAAVDGG